MFSFSAQKSINLITSRRNKREGIENPPTKKLLCPKAGAATSSPAHLSAEHEMGFKSHSAVLAHQYDFSHSFNAFEYVAEGGWANLFRKQK